MTLRSFLLSALVAVLAATALSLLTCAPRANAAPDCSTSTVSNMNFGSPNVLPGTAVDTTAAITVNCTGTPGGAQNWCLSIGQGGGGVSGTDRLMASGGATVTYNLYQDAARSVPWGSRNNSALGTVPAMAGTGGSATNFTVTLYGRINANQSTVAPGSYASSFFGSADTNLFMLTSPSTDCMTGPIDGTVPTVQPSFTVSATPGANCNLTTNPLAFGAQGLLNADVDATTTLQVQCTSTSPYNVGLDAGQASGATVSTRRMTFGAATVSYALYRDAGRTLNWGQTIGTDTLAGTGTGVSQTITVYGRVPVQTTPAPGTYTDTVAVTVTY